MEQRNSPVRQVACAAVLAACAVLCACQLPMMDAYGVVVTTGTITLEWDPPPGSSSFAGFAVSRYSVFFRSHGAQSWQYFGSVPAGENPGILLHHSDFGNGWYDFAVQAYSDRTGGSPLHSSLDATAQPFGGWFLKWDYSD